VPVSVIIPTLNEVERIPATIVAAMIAGAAEVIVSDGGSSDATIEAAREYGARVVTGATMRASQLNLGAREAAHDALLFLHADTLLPPGACAAVERAIAEGIVFGGFRIGFIESGLGLAAALINLRTRITREPWGDQAQFTSRAAFPGFPEIPIMEDYELARRMKKIGRSALLPLTVRTSGRRFCERGAVRTAALNWWIIACYHAGVSPARLARWYR
jgi:rSAM/selenodomain-associated transferase 2